MLNQEGTDLFIHHRSYISEVHNGKILFILKVNVSFAVKALERLILKYIT